MGLAAYLSDAHERVKKGEMALLRPSALTGCPHATPATARAASLVYLFTYTAARLTDSRGSHMLLLGGSAESDLIKPWV